MRRMLCILALLGTSSPLSSAEERSPLPFSPAHREYVTQRWEGPAPLIDGKLDDPGWKQGVWAGDFVQREPQQGAAPSLPTFIKVLYDDKNLYIAFRCIDPEVATRRRVLAAPDEFAGDMVGVSIDSFLNQKTAFEFNVTSGGSKVDAVLPNFGWSDVSWRAVWDVKVGQETDAWVAEYRIPLSQLRYAPTRQQVWGIHFWRWIEAKQEESQYSFIPLAHTGIVRSFGELRGIENLPRSRRLEVAPYVVGSYQTHAPEPDNPLKRRRESKWNAGVDAKYGITTGLTLDATLNPDFGQVEADPSEINLTTVETFLKEQRPFFLEGKSVFDFKIDEDQVFYSRRIGAAPLLESPDAAFAVRPTTSRVLGSAKVTGRTEAGTTVGALWATTDRTYGRISDGVSNDRVLINPLTHYYALRAQQDFAQGDLIVGGIVTGATRVGTDDQLRELPRQALVGGAELTRYWNSHTYFVDARVLRSHIAGSSESIAEKQQEWVHNYQRVDAEDLDVSTEAHSLGGHAGSVRGGKDNSGTWRYQGFVTWRSPGFDMNDVGYLGQADSVSPGARLDYFATSNNGYFRRQLHSLRLRENYDFSGLRTGRSAFVVSEVNTTENHNFWAQAGVRTHRVDTRILRGGPALRVPENATLSLHFTGDQSRRLVPKLWADWSRSLGSPASYFQMEPALVYRPAPSTSVEFGVEMTLNRQKYQYAATGDFGGQDGWVVSRMRQNTLASTLRVTHNFSPSLTLTYFAGPYITSGRYSEFKRVVSPRASHLEERFRTLVTRAADDAYEGVDNGEAFRFENPDFSWRELKTNLVMRWEYRPGSFVYCVWSQQRTDGTDDLKFRPVAEHLRLFSARPENVFLVKASYWFSL